MKIAIAQINCTVGDLAGNAAKILDYVAQAKQAGATVVVAPELAICGYPPEDLLLRDKFYEACAETLEGMATAVTGIVLVVGHPAEYLGERFNAASVIRDGKVVMTYHKLRLPNYTVFDEERYFAVGNKPCVFTVEGVRFGINICADIWEPTAAKIARSAGAEVLLVLNASPYHIHKQKSRYEAVQERISENCIPIVYANMIGGQDELVFDGASFVANSSGEITQQLPSWVETLGLVSFENGEPVRQAAMPIPSLEADVYKALCLGVRDYVEKNNFPGILLGLSGGIDSALTLAIAVDALGAACVRAVMMPSPYTAQISLDDAREMVEILKVRYDEIAIEPIFNAFLNTLTKEFEGLATDTTEENLQARIRGTILMAMSNKYGSIVLTTGNKSEMSVGYATLYGDMAGGFAVLKDISKTLVYRLARYRNVLSQVIPERIITRAPSAELKPDQTDQDSLPPYEVLDAIMEAYVEYNRSPEEIIAAGYRTEDVRRVVHLIKISEHKRRQAPIGVRITNRGFGKDWRYPITSKYRDI